MTLGEFLKEAGESQTVFARRIRTTPETICRICNGTMRIPRYELMHRIWLATGGKVEPNDFYRFADGGVTLAPRRKKAA